mmetsp:Transcript_41027/g.95375  ORF Transcript_41027/g.95375 Transcript_41027/m.95375 type:complete len:119 (-) Transcript_41027:681-1037(-)
MYMESQATINPWQGPHLMVRRSPRVTPPYDRSGCGTTLKFPCGVWIFLLPDLEFRCQLKLRMRRDNALEADDELSSVPTRRLGGGPVGLPMGCSTLTWSATSKSQRSVGVPQLVMVLT